MKFFVFSFLCLFIILLSFIDFIASDPITVFSFVLMYGDFFKNISTIEKKYFVQILSITLPLIFILWCLIPSVFKYFHISKNKIRNILLIFLTIFFTYLAFFRVEIQVLFVMFFKNTSFYEDNYIPYSLRKENIPQKKKNLILIFAESFEQSYADPSLFDAPLLSKLPRQPGFSFSEFQQLNGTENTISALAAAFCGIPVMPVLPSSFRNEINYTFPSAVCLTDILNNAGYDTSFYFSSTEYFSNKVDFLKEHGVNHIAGSTVMRRNENDNGLMDFLAVKDSRTFEVLKEKIQELAQKETPFFIGVTTVNTHEPTGYLEETCKRTNSSVEFEDIVSCSDDQISDFIDFIKTTKVYPNTAIVVIGDHLARRNPLYDTLEKSENRFIFNRFVNINLPVSTERSFSMLDLGATLLEMLGFVLPQKGLGLGRSLLSSQEPTLIEKYGIEHIHGEILKNSAFYKKLLKEQHIDQPENKKGQ